jgi:hypothetical protein
MGCAALSCHYSLEASFGGMVTKSPNHSINPTWLIGVLFEFLTRIGVGWLVEVLTP